MTNRFLLMFVLLLSAASVAQTQPAAFDGVDKWKGSLMSSDTAALKSLYSTDPPAQFIGAERKPVPDISPELDFWQKLVASGATDLEVNTVEQGDQKGMHFVTLAVSLKVKTPDGPRTRYVNEDQAWLQQGGTWRIVIAKHSALVKMRPALKQNANLYPKEVDAKAEIKEAVGEAAKDHQRVILVFGANWCYDCHVLDQAFHQEDVVPLLTKNFRVVHVDIGDNGKKNNDLAADYKVPLNKGIPALAILGADGKLVYSQQNGEWESARSMDPDDILAFLNKWKP
jgi:thioredoxin 1